MAIDPDVQVFLDALDQHIEDAFAEITDIGTQITALASVVADLDARIAALEAVPEPAPEPQPEPVISASPGDDLAALIADAPDGSVIELADGQYSEGWYSLTGVHAQGLASTTLRAANQHGAVFGGLDVQNCSGIVFDGIKVHNTGTGGTGSNLVDVKSSTFIDFQNCRIEGPDVTPVTGWRGVKFEDCAQFSVIGSQIECVLTGIYTTISGGFAFSENTFDKLGEDAVKIDRCNNGSITNNTGAREYRTAPGGHPDFIQFQGGKSSDIGIRGNVQLPGNSTAAYVQLFMLDSPAHEAITIEQNIGVTGVIHGVTASNAANIDIWVRDNTFLNLPGGQNAATQVQVGGAGATNLGNLMGTKDTNSPIADGNARVTHAQYAANFTGPVAVGMTIADLRPISGSVAETAGAHVRLAELLGET